MKQIDYIEIINLGFEEQYIDDKVYYNKYGYEYCLITKRLTKRIYIDYAKETRHCKIVRVDKNNNIKSEVFIKDLKSLKGIIKFFTDEQSTD